MEALNGEDGLTEQEQHVDREQVRRDAEKLRGNIEAGLRLLTKPRSSLSARTAEVCMEDLAKLAASHDALLAELEQDERKIEALERAEEAAQQIADKYRRERNEARNESRTQQRESRAQMTARVNAEARLASVPALVEALKELERVPNARPDYRLGVVRAALAANEQAKP